MWQYRENIRKAVGLIETFYDWSGLKVNIGKTHLTIYDKENKKPNFIDELGIKWCNELKLLGIPVNITLTKMNRNF